MFVGGEIKLVGLHFTCASGLGPTTDFPSGLEGYYFKVDSGINSDRQFVTQCWCFNYTTHIFKSSSGGR